MSEQTPGRLSDQHEQSDPYDNCPDVIGVGRRCNLCEQYKARLQAVERERDEAYEYLSRLLTILAPQCAPLRTLLGVATQIDNYITGLLGKLEAINQIAALIEERPAHD